MKRRVVKAYTKETFLRPNKRSDHDGFQHYNLIIPLIFEGLCCTVYGL